MSRLGNSREFRSLKMVRETRLASLTSPLESIFHRASHGASRGRITSLDGNDAWSSVCGIGVYHTCKEKFNAFFEYRQFRGTPVKKIYYPLSSR